MGSLGVMSYSPARFLPVPICLRLILGGKRLVCVCAEICMNFALALTQIWCWLTCGGRLVQFHPRQFCKEGGRPVIDLSPPFYFHLVEKRCCYSTVVDHRMPASQSGASQFFVLLNIAYIVVSWSLAIVMISGLKNKHNTLWKVT
jgi:hypothetical protein